MRHLIGFSLKRRFANKFTAFIGVVLLVVFLIVGFSDKILKFFKPNLFEPVQISVKVDDVSLFESILDEGFSVSETSEISVIESDGSYEINSDVPVSLSEELILKEQIVRYHSEKVLRESGPKALHLVDAISNPLIEMNVLEESTNREHDMLFVIITAVYFMMIGFAAMIAQEIVGEKTTNILELIGISISLKVHYYSKIIIGWLSVFLQVVFAGGLFMLVTLLRYLVDDGKGLFKFLNQLGLLNIEAESISELIKMMRNQKEILGLFLISLAFLFIGILFIQMILVLMTTRVHTMEEASSIQSPFYIVLLILYYVAMFLNNQQSMTEGLGYLLSFFPVTSMIFMPSRLLIYHPPTVEVIVALCISLVCLLVLIKIGEKEYCEHVLDTSKKNKRFA